MENIIITLDESFSNYLSDIRENENKRIENEQARMEYFESINKKFYCKQYKKAYGTIRENEFVFGLPKEYSKFCILDVYINGCHLNPTEYVIQNKNVYLRNAITTIGTIIEIVATKIIGLDAIDLVELRSEFILPDTESDSITLYSSNWIQNEETGYYEYDIIDETVTKKHLVNGYPDLKNQNKMVDAEIRSYDGGYKFITTKMPTEDITMDITIQLVVRRNDNDFIIETMPYDETKEYYLEQDGNLETVINVTSDNTDNENFIIEEI